jgi:tRNA modification GTPase
MIEGALRVDGLHSPVPCAAYVWPTPRSYTGQVSIEIHTVGSPPILQAALRTVCRLGARLAERGEFTLRAFLAGRLDLTQAEAVLGVIDARDRGELDVALAQLAGGLAGPLNQLRDDLLELLAHLEAGLDFVEEDIDFISREQLHAQISAAACQVEQIAEQAASRAVLSEVVRVAFIGSPNAGKSSLFNALLGHTAAIVSPTAGTTRDYLLGKLHVDGVDFELVDTAGLIPDIDASTTSVGKPAQVPIEEQAQHAAVGQRRQAAIELFCVDASRPLSEWERVQLEVHPTSTRLIVRTKCDRPSAVDPTVGAISTSSSTGAGLDELRSRMHAAALEGGGEVDRMVSATAARCRNSLRAAAAALLRAQQLVVERSGEELVAVEIRAALDDLGQVVGAVYTEDLLDRIFSRFCIGK